MQTSKQKKMTYHKSYRMFDVAMVAMDGHGEDTNWYLDSGATKHVTRRSKYGQVYIKKCSSILKTIIFWPNT